MSAFDGLKNAYSEWRDKPAREREERTVQLRSTIQDGSLNRFISELKRDGQRVGKAYLYEVEMYINVDGGGIEKLNMMCNKASIPGYRNNTQRGKIYGLSYEIPVSIEYDPLWLSFYSDVLHQIPSTFFYYAKSSEFNPRSVFESDSESLEGSFSPKYKSDLQFDMVINILDENFKKVVTHKFINCFIRTVQQLPLGYSEKNIPEVTVEVIFENSRIIKQDNHSRSSTQGLDGSVDKTSYSDQIKENELKNVPAANRGNFLTQTKDAVSNATGGRVTF